MLLLAAQAQMQTQTQDVKNVDVKSLPQSEINKAKRAMQDAGLSEEQAIQLARQRGATEQQIMEMRERLSEQDTSQQDMFELYEEPEELPEKTEDSYLSQRKVEFKEELEVFGAYLFNNENLTFEPQVNHTNTKKTTK